MSTEHTSGQNEVAEQWEPIGVYEDLHGARHGLFQSTETTERSA
jgi:hypothetical protein